MHLVVSITKDKKGIFQTISKPKNRDVTRDAINIVAETVVAPFPLVATWKKANKSSCLKCV